ncbi:hypothetical protein MM236_02015 [Belliella sp. DSM 107340]|uniref:site-specific DNA-methyltransferase (adenine-specific) n=1 Tax=Belliella calami TaxID=2923436 RepID=A0ABS9UJE4_9BACT|nr:hypothetical protein [Belliella calami]MCH7396739.1 hypothetical protein [Belliella calami]
MIKFIQNTGDFFAANYFDEDFSKKVLEKTGYAADDIKVFQKRITGLKDKYFKFKKAYLEENWRTKDKITETHRFHTDVLNALGYAGDQPEYTELFHVDEKTVLPIRHTLYRGDRPFLMIMEMRALIKEGDEDPDGLFEQCYHSEENNSNPPQKYHRSQWENVFRVPEGLSISPMIINKAVSELFLLDQHRRPQYILLCAGNVFYLLEQEKWFRGSYLSFDLEELFSEGVVSRDYYTLFYFLLAKETLAPQSEIVLMDQLDEDSHKSAYEVTQDLKEGVIHAVESLANEAVFFIKTQDENRDLYNEPSIKSQDTEIEEDELIINVENGDVLESTDDSQKSISINADTLKNECLNYVYRLLFLFYAESRNDLDILPADDAVYQHGYSLEMLRDLEQVPLNTASSQNGYFFHESLSRLFQLLSTGYKEKADQERNRSFKVRHLDSPLFDNEKLEILPNVKIRNVVWQDVICQLSLSRKQKGKTRGRISYANLGINQLGSVYESLLAFRGFFAETDTIEVHRKRKDKETSEKVARTDGSYLVPRHRIDDFDPDEIFTDKEGEIKIIPKGTFIYRLSGRDRQKSASYYTPEVLTECTVKYTLKPILERLDKGEMKALDLLDLKILEPAMGAAAFHNEVINQLSEAYLSYRQEEMKQKVAPDKYREELQKIKAYIALNNVYGVDLNPTAVELGKLSLWLNVIHQDMQTPFFGYRLGVGNAVVGAWLKVYKGKEILFDAKNKREKKEWWDKAPKHIPISGRKADEIYHFLLPDKNLVPSAGIKLLKEAHGSESKSVSEWKKEFCSPIREDEFQRLQRISKGIDLLLEEHYRFQASINAETKVRDTFFGAYNEGDQVAFKDKSYSEKEKLANKRGETNAPYYKLKMIMDYWCSLWFWDMRQASELPSRREWLQDIEAILHMDLDNLEAKVQEDGDFLIPPKPVQSKLFSETEPQQLTLKTYNKNKGETLKQLSQKLDKERVSLFTNTRSQIVQELAEQYRFFHYQLEFIEVFKERGGFDVAVGNPPWLKIEFEEKIIMSEVFPEFLIRNLSAPKIKELRSNYLKNSKNKEIYIEDVLATESLSKFSNNLQSYDLLKGQQGDLYKNILVNTINIINSNGYAGILHPTSIYDDAKGEILRQEIYSRLKFIFHFRNEFKLFKETNDKGRLVFAINIYSGKINNSENFYLLSNLFHPSTIDGCLRYGSNGQMAIKIKDKDGKYIWNTQSNIDRLVLIDRDLIDILKSAQDAKIAPKLIYLQAGNFKDILTKISKIKTKKLNKTDLFFTLGLHETNDVGENNMLLDINHNTRTPDINKYEFIYNGPHFTILNPISQSPKINYKSNNDYESVDLSTIDENYLPNTKYLPNKDGNFTPVLNKFGNNWYDSFRWATRAMVGPNSERTLQPVIISPKTHHIHGVLSILFKNELELLSFTSLTASLIFDFYVKVNGWSNIQPNSIEKFPVELGFYHSELTHRILLLNCLNKYYTQLWKRHFKQEFREDSWSKNDDRLKSFATLTPDWSWNTPLRNWFERRQALVEIDVITAMALGLTLEELILIYNVQFPVLQQNEDDTWYDQRGNIVFTCSKGLTGVGLDRAEWNEIKNMKAGETYNHTITKSELYHGKQVTYYAPFDKCDRVEDYKLAWGVFEERFGGKGVY